MKRLAVLDEIAAFVPEDGNWLPLDELLCQLWEMGVGSEHLPVVFGLFERFPDEDGAGVLWGVVHGVESLGVDYDQALRESISRQPSLMGRIMLGRLERANAG